MQSYYFVFCKEDLLLLKNAEGEYTIPLCEEPPTETKPWTHLMNITPMDDGTPVVTYRVDTPVETVSCQLSENESFEMIGLRQSFYKLEKPLYLKAG